MWKRILTGGMFLAALFVSTGCCRMWDRWCAPRPQQQCCPAPCNAPPAQQCAPACYPAANACN